MIYFLKAGDYDFLHGAIGNAFYFFNRFRCTKSDKLKSKYMNILLEFIDLIEELSEKTEKDKLRWPSILDRKKHVSGYNLSLSHGMASLLGFFNKLCEFNVFKHRVQPLLRYLINYILDLKKDDSITSCIFPSTILQDGNISYSGRVAWCYGDLGLAMCFWYSSKALKDKELEDLSLSMLKRVANRITFESNKVIDAGMCHGSFGNAQIFNRMYKKTGEIIFKNASDFWIRDGLEKAEHDDGYAGFKQYRFDAPWVTELNLINGIAGIGLTIIDYLSENEYDWDECLMIS